MSKLIDLTGQRFGRLVVLERAENDRQQNPQWLCKCDCGATTIVRGYCLRDGGTKSCGCLRSEISSKRVYAVFQTHNSSNTRLYYVWEGMKDRCYNKNSSAFQRYGGRGIKMCDEWRNDFQSFMDWSVSNGYDVHLTIDRINNDGNYEPSNCRWVTMLEQQNNKRSNKILTLNGEGHTISQWSRLVGISPQTISERLKRGWGVEKAITTKVGG